MMAFITRYWKRIWANAVWHGLALALLLMQPLVQAQSLTEISQFRAERVDDEVLVSAQIGFELSPAVEDALVKGIPLYFSAEANVFRERWYWYDKNVGGTQRRMRLAYQPLTRHWRLNVTSGTAREGDVGLALNQSFDTLALALSAIKRISRWKVADAGDLDGSLKYRVELRFRLDLSQLPRPFQIGALGQADWDIASMASTPVAFDNPR